MNLASILFTTCDVCNTSIRGDTVKHIRRTTYGGTVTEYYHPACFFIVQQRKMEQQIKNPAYRSVNASQAN